MSARRRDRPAGVPDEAPEEPHGVELTPQERALPSWLPLGPPQPRASDPVDVAAIERLLRGVRQSYGWWHWGVHPFDDDVSPQAAAFWLRLASHAGGHRTPREALEQELGRGADVELPAKEVFRLADRSQLPPARRAAAVMALVEPAVVAERLLAGIGEDDGHTVLWDLAAQVRPLLLPSLTAADRDSLRDRTERAIRSLLSRSDRLRGTELLLAAALGLHEEVERVLATWPDGWLGEFYSHDALHHCAYVLGLGDAERCVDEAVRLGIDMAGEEGAAAWLAVTGTERLDRFEWTLMRAPNRDLAALTAQAWFRRVHDPAMAPHALAALRSRAPAEARAWLDAHPRAAVTGLAPLLARGGSVAETARDELARLLRTSATRTQATAAVETLAGADAERVGELLAAAARLDVPALTQTPGWLAAPELERGRLPAWLDVAALPRLVIGDRRLADEDVERVVRALRAAGQDADPGGAVRALAQAADAQSADGFAWALLQAWLTAGAPSRDAWALMAVGHLGGDRAAQRLTPLVRTWPGEGQHRRALVGLRALRTIGSETALMLLDGIAQRLKFKALREAARTAIEAIAAERGMSKEELEDMIVPDAGLDADGSRRFDYGARGFAFVLGPGLKPMVRDEAGGRPSTSLPKPREDDDAALAADAREQWKVVRRTVADTVKLQTARLEDAMVTQRAWTAAAFERHLAGHPLMRELVRLLVLEATGPDGPRHAFRLTGDGALVDASGAAVTLGDDEQVTVVHPLQLEASDRAAWSEALARAELVQPFAQLERPTYDMTAGELAGRDLVRFAGDHVEPRTLIGLLERRGWRREGVADGGLYYNHVKEFAAAGLTVAVGYEEGIPVGSVEDAGPLAVDHCYAVPGRPRDHAWAYEDAQPAALRWEHVDPIVRSEVLTVLVEVAARSAA